MPMQRHMTAALAVAIAALAVTACGADEQTSPSAERSGDSQQPERPAQRDEDAAEPGDEAEDEPARCTFEAPPGRLAEDSVVLELDGVSCEEGMRAARAAALGQPAGANLVVRSGGFECEPSTLEKGVNVTYTCSGDAGEATFDVVWSAGAP